MTACRRLAAASASAALLAGLMASTGCALSGSLAASFAPCPLSSGGTTDPPTGRLVVTIIEVDPVSDLEGDDDFVPFYDNHADIEGRVTIDGTVFALPKIDDNDHPFWGVNGGVFVQQVAATPDPTGLQPLPIPIRIEIFESDGGLTGDDDIVDINPQAGKTHLDLVFDLCSLAISGDVASNGSQVPLDSSGGSDDDDATIRFTITLEDGRPMSIDDLALMGFDLVQVVPQVDRLVADKPTVLQVQVANNYTIAVAPELAVRIIANGAVFHDDLFTLDFLAAGEVRSFYLYESVPLVFPSSLNGGDPYDVRVTVTLDPNGQFPDTGHSLPGDCRARNNGGNMRPAWAVVPTEPPRTLWAKTGLLLDVGNTTPDNHFEEIRDLGEAYIRGVYPIAELPQSTSPVPIFPPLTTVADWVFAILPFVDAAEPFLMVAELGGIGYLAGYDRTLGVLPNKDWFSLRTGWSDVNGVSLVDALPRAVIFLPRKRSPVGPAITLPAHELGHTYGLSVDSTLKDNALCSKTDIPIITTLICGIVGGYDEYEHTDPEFKKGNPARGYWVAQGGETSAVAHLLGQEQCDSHCFMGLSPANAHLAPDPGDDPVWLDKGRWVEPAGYDALFNKLASSSTAAPAPAPLPPATAADTLYISALITEDGAFIAATHWFRLPGKRRIDVLDRGEAEWGQLRFRDVNGKLLGEEAPLPFRPLRLDRPGADAIPVSIVGRTVRFPEGARRIEVVRDLEKGAEEVVYERPISAAAPVVTAVELDGTRHPRGEPVTAAWRSADADGDALIYTVLVRAARSADWWPVAVYVDAQIVEIETTDLPEGPYRMKVQAADGIHVGESPEVAFEVY